MTNCTRRTSKFLLDTWQDRRGSAEEKYVVVVEDNPELIQSLAKRVDGLERENKILREENALLKKWRFGRSSERIEPGQLTLFEDGLAPPTEQANEAEAPRRSGRKKTRGHGREPFPEHLPREVIRLELAEKECSCSCCGTALVEIGVDVTERGHFVPARIIVHRYERPKYACPHGHEVRSPQLPPGVTEKAKYEASVYAHIAVSKYTDHVPLHRLQGIFKRHGVPISKQLMWDMLVVVDELVAQPVLAAMRGELLKEDVLHADETPVRLRVEGKKGSSTSYVWGWRSLAESESPKVLVEFRENRSRAGPMNFLGDWSGTLIADGYSGYDEVCRRNSIVRAGCWAHARRKLKEAWDTGAKDAEAPLRLVNRFFRLERAVNKRAKARQMNRASHLELRARVRNRRSRLLVEKIHEVSNEIERKASTLPKSKLGKAISYLANQAKPLGVALGDPRIPIHNNDQERDIRHIVTGRKNWLLFASPRGGAVACRLYSLVLSCLQNGVDPEDYFEDVLMAVATTPHAELASLTPWGWAAARSARTKAEQPGTTVV